MTTIVITQPTYMPWIGYFHQLLTADIFVVLDSVQFVKRSWQCRNRIISREGSISYLTLAVKKTSRNCLIKDIEINDDFNIQSHIDKIKQHYPFAANNQTMKQLIELMRESIKDERLLSVVNTNLLKNLCQSFKLKLPEIVFASLVEKKLEFHTATERLLNIARAINADHYISALGSYEYMKDDLNKFADAGIQVSWQQFKYTPYTDSPFVSHLSIVDYIAHVGFDKLNQYINSCGSYVVKNNL